jgi:hypothetical protein
MWPCKERKYELLRTVTLQDIVNAGDGEENYCFRKSYQSAVEKLQAIKEHMPWSPISEYMINAIVGDNEEWADWLIEHDFIKKVEPKRTFKAGQAFRDNAGIVYLLAQTDNGTVQVIAIQHNDANRLNNIKLRPADNSYKITEGEMRRLMPRYKSMTEVVMRWDDKC